MKFKFTIQTKENYLSNECPYPNGLDECENQIIELARDLEHELSNYDCYTVIDNRTISVDIQNCTEEDFIEWTKPIVNNYKCYFEVAEFEVLN